jgi:hypothetical protein
MRSEAKPLDEAGVVAGEVAGAVVGATDGVVTLGSGEGGADVGDGGAVSVGGALALGDEVVITPLALCAHAAARHPAPAMAATSSTPFTRCRNPDPSTRLIMAETAR